MGPDRARKYLVPSIRTSTAQTKYWRGSRPPKSIDSAPELELDKAKLRVRLGADRLCQLHDDTLQQPLGPNTGRIQVLRNHDLTTSHTNRA